MSNGMINKPLREQLSSMLMEDGKEKISLVRASIAAMLLTYIVWGTYIVFMETAIPDLPVQVAALLGSLYALNKAIKIKIGGKDATKD